MKALPNPNQRIRKIINSWTFTLLYLYQTTVSATIDLSENNNQETTTD